MLESVAGWACLPLGMSSQLLALAQNLAQNLPQRNFEQCLSSAMFGDVDEAQARQFAIENFEYAASWVGQGYYEALDCHLFERGNCVYETDESGDNLLDLAIKHDAGPRVVRVLVRYDVEVYQGLLDTAVDLGRDDAVIALLELGVYMNSYFGDWRRIIEKSLWKSDEVLLVDDCIECGIDCTQRVAMLRCEVAEQVRRAERMISSSRFPGTDDYAACEWLRGFCERHPETPEARLIGAFINQCDAPKWKMQLVMLRALALKGRATPNHNYGVSAALISLPSRAFATVIRFWGGIPLPRCY